MTTLTASPTKLGATWGATVAGATEIGDTITITTKAGQSWDDEVTGIVRKIEHICHGTQTVVRVAGRKPASAVRKPNGYNRRPRTYGGRQVCQNCGEHSMGCSGNYCFNV